MLVVNSSKNPAHDTKNSAEHNKVQRRGGCLSLIIARTRLMAQNPWRNIAKLARRRVLVVITARTRAGGYVLLLGIASSCILAPENHMDVLKTRCEEQARCNSPLYLDRGVGVCFGKARSHPHAASRSALLMTVSARCRLPKHGRKLTRLSLASAELSMER